jgi:hypothetical protein
MDLRGMVIVVAAGLALATAACQPGNGPAHPAGGALPTSVAEFFGPDLRIADFGSFGQDDVSIIPAGDPAFAAALRVFYPAHSASRLSAAADETALGGAQYYLSWLGGPTDEAYLRYFVRFEQGFDFVKGGKLPGLYGGRVTGGRRIPDGTNGFSTRYMWRADGAGEVYAYLPTSVRNGTSLGRGAWVWPAGVWTEVQQQVKLNDPGRSNGEIRVWLNQVPVLALTGVTFRSDPDLRIEGLFFSTFFGGGDASWASPRDQYADFAGFTVSTSFIGD